MTKVPSDAALQLWRDQDAFIQSFVDELARHFEGDENLSGSDAVEWLQSRYFDAKEMQSREVHNDEGD